VSEARRLSSAELASRVWLDAEAGGAWFLLLLEEGAEAGAVADEIAAECAALSPRLAQHRLRVADGLPALIGACTTGEGALVIALADGIDNVTLGQLDEARSAILRAAAGVFLLPDRDLERFAREAPNLASVLAVRTFAWGDDPGLLDADSREAMLVGFRERSRMSDADLVAAATAGAAPAEPYVAEWLVLLGRGDLLGAR
jgi:hypothetical protein